MERHGLNVEDKPAVTRPINVLQTGDVEATTRCRPVPMNVHDLDRPAHASGPRACVS